LYPANITNHLSLNLGASNPSSSESICGSVSLIVASLGVSTLSVSFVNSKASISLILSRLGLLQANAKKPKT